MEIFISFLIKEVAYETKMLFNVNICMIYMLFNNKVEYYFKRLEML